MFGKFDGAFEAVIAQLAPPGPQNLILEGLTALHASRESSVAHLGPSC